MADLKPENDNSPPSTLKNSVNTKTATVKDANGDAVHDDQEQKIVDEIESLCMNCHKNGTTTLLLTKIPFFREVILSSFYCPHCNFRNSEIQPAGELQPKGVRYTFRSENKEDLNRQIVKSDTCALKIEEIDLEIPAGHGQLTNVEGVLRMVEKDLGDKQDEREAIDKDLYEKIDAVIQKLSQMAAGAILPFVISLDDPAGNSWVEPSTSDGEGKRVKHEYIRSPEQNVSLGLAATDEVPAEAVKMRPEYHATQMYPYTEEQSTTNNADEEDDIIENNVYTFPATCSSCQRPCDTNMKMVNIPYFREVVIMSTNCDYCGYKSSEVKTGGEIPEKGRQITISVASRQDLNRDILKSETCTMDCPELELHVQAGTMGGRFTTVEGLLVQVRDDLHKFIFGDDDEDSATGDSMPAETKENWKTFFDRLESAIKGEKKFELILKDPFASSYLQSLTAPEPDEQIKVTDYERTEEEEERLGLRDIKTEGYEEQEKES